MKFNIFYNMSVDEISFMLIFFLGGLFMLDEQIKDDLVLLLKKMNLCSIAREEICNLLDRERQKPEAIKTLRNIEACYWKKFTIGKNYWII